MERTAEKIQGRGCHMRGSNRIVIDDAIGKIWQEKVQMIRENKDSEREREREKSYPSEDHRVQSCRSKHESLTSSNYWSNKYNEDDFIRFSPCLLSKSTDLSWDLQVESTADRDLDEEERESMYHYHQSSSKRLTTSLDDWMQNLSMFVHICFISSDGEFFFFFTCLSW